MPRFAVRYVSGPGAVGETILQASRRQAIATALGVRSIDILTVRELPPSASPTEASTLRMRAAGHVGSTRTSFPLRTFCHELAILLESGIPLYEALQTLCDKERDPFVAQVLSDLTALLAQGQTFAHALAAQPRIFGPLFIASVEASQRTGQIPHALRRHSEYLAWLGGLRDKLVTACIYPAMLIVAGSLVMLFLTVYVVPRFAQIYADLGGDLPLMSRWLMQFGQAIGEHPIVVAAMGATLLACAVWTWRSTAVRAILASRLWRLPYIGERLRLMELAALYRTLGLLLQAGVPVVPALDACKGVVGTASRKGLIEVTQRVSEGARLSDSLEAQELGTPVSVRMLRVGEHSGETGPMLERAAIFYDEELLRFTEWIGKVLNPVLMLVMGVLVGGVVVLMYLPIFQVAEQIQ